MVWRPFTLVRAMLPELAEVDLKTSRDELLFPDLPEDRELGPFNVQSRDPDLRDALLDMQPGIMERFPHREAGALGEQYLELFDMLTPDALKPFYHALNPQYFEWLRA